MSDTPSIIPTEKNSVWAERTGTRQYVGRNHSGAEVRIGTGPGEFSPGELLKLALATCNSLSADHRLTKALGEDFDANVVCATTKNDEDERYDSFEVQLVADYSSLSAEQLAVLRQRVDGAIDRSCTVGHTLEKSPQVRLLIVQDPDAEPAA
ncbi:MULTISPECIES: OsmC family protein [Actinomyces]|uniref:OsmC family peroxiredoxin n=1 Tax=Actinomyces marmotae TaxID=2737173 RepID=A0A6M8B5U8_9ACTO|nr:MULTISPECIES: OsmC family protein [Actinomyces]QKD79466.1 OsmC family peroxiredoxin [Actinomyces marmotae]